MGEKRDMFEGLGCDGEIENLGDSYISVNPSPERERDERSGRDRFHDDYVITPFLQSTQAWRMKAEENRRQYAEKNLTKCIGGNPNDVVDLSTNIWLKPGDVDDNSIDIEEVKVAEESLKTLHFRKKMRGLSPHRLPLKERKKDRTISYLDLLRPNPPPKIDPCRKPGASTRLALRKSS
jgi:hypothetical protein